MLEWTKPDEAGNLARGQTALTGTHYPAQSFKQRARSAGHKHDVGMPRKRSPTFTRCLPKFWPVSIGMKAWLAASIPSSRVNTGSTSRNAQFPLTV